MDAAAHIKAKAFSATFERVNLQAMNNYEGDLRFKLKAM